MADHTKDGGPAFPHGNQEMGTRHRIAQPGMSLRDYFAGQALIGMTQPADAYGYEELAAAIARGAYRIADAMLAERAKGGAA